MLAVYSVIILILIIIIIRYKWKRRILVKMMNQFPGPPMKPIFGNAFNFSADTAKTFNIVKEIWREYKSPSRLWLLHKPYVLIYSPEDFQKVAWKTLEKDSCYKFIVDMLGDGIFTSKVEKWRIHRKELSAAFNPLYLKIYFLKIFSNQNAKLVKKLTKKVGTGEYFDLWPYLIQSSITTISQTAIGCSESFPEEKIVEFGSAVIKSAEMVSRRICQPWLHPSFIFTVYKHLKGYGNLFKTVQDFPLQMLNNKERKTLNENGSENSNVSDPEDQSSRNFIGILTEAKSKYRFTEQELKDEVISIMFGGSETNSVTVGFLLVMLAIHQDVQENVYQELYQVFGNSNRLPDLEDTTKLLFLEQCIKETLRRFPIVPVVLRYANEDIPISNNYVIPKGANVALCIAAIHHDPSIYPDPLSWNPNNFTPEKEAARHKCAFVPFSEGPRGCIGQKYAWVAMKLQLSTLLRNFRFYTDMKMEDIEFNIDFIIRSKCGYKVKLEYRNNE